MQLFRSLKKDLIFFAICSKFLIDSCYIDLRTIKTDFMTREQIVLVLNSGVVNFKYTKKDGSERIASGTRQMEFIKTHGAEPKGTGTEKIGVITYYDLEKQGWRSFNEENFVEFL